MGKARTLFEKRALGNADAIYHFGSLAPRNTRHYSLLHSTATLQRMGIVLASYKLGLMQ
jgi:hypothetical protein